MTRKKLSFKAIMELAEQYGVSENVLFRSAADRYMGQVEMIAKIQKDIDSRGLMIERINVKGDVNPEPNPLCAQLPKFNDTANKTLGQMLDIILKLGTQAPAGDKLGEFLDE